MSCLGAEDAVLVFLALAVSLRLFGVLVNRLKDMYR
jgi:hypothetical protein